MKSSALVGSGCLFAEDSGFVPAEGAVVAPEVLADVFADTELPFAANADGSVNLDVYRAWLASTWKAGMAEFDEQSTVFGQMPATAPGDKRAPERVATSK
jgi:hypothetical protein